MSSPILVPIVNVASATSPQDVTGCYRSPTRRTFSSLQRNTPQVPIQCNTSQVPIQRKASQDPTQSNTLQDPIFTFIGKVNTHKTFCQQNVRDRYMYMYMCTNGCAIYVSLMCTVSINVCFVPSKFAWHEKGRTDND